MGFWWVALMLVSGGAQAQAPAPGEITVTDAYGTFRVPGQAGAEATVRTVVEPDAMQSWFQLNEDEIHAMSTRIMAARPAPRRSRAATGLTLSTTDLLPTTLAPISDFAASPRAVATDSLSLLFPAFGSIVSFIRDFIDRFREMNDRGFANLRNFRAEFTQRLSEMDDGRLRVDLIVEAYRHYRVNSFSFNIEAGGAGVRLSYDPDPERRLTLGISVLPAYGEMRSLLFSGRSIGNDLLLRASAAGLISVRPIDGVEVGAIVSFQPQWVDFGHFRSLQEIYARLTVIPGRAGNDQYYIQELVFIPRLIQWVNTDPSISLTPGMIRRMSDDAGNLSRIVPELLSPSHNEVILMGSLAFRFSL